MATDQVKPMAGPEFTWGETVRFRGDERIPGKKGALAEVCGAVVIETAEHAKAVIDGRIGVEAYLIEFGDGESFEVVGALLEKVL